MGQLTGKYTVVTGGGKGIGRAVVERFLKEDAAGVAILDYDEATAQATAKELADKRVLVVKCDVSDEAAVAAAFAKVYEAFGRVDVLINNAEQFGISDEFAEENLRHFVTKYVELGLITSESDVDKIMEMIWKPVL